QYDRFLWFLVLALVATSSLLINYTDRMISSYGLFLVVYFLFTLSRPSTEEQYKRTLQGFQFLVVTLCCIGVVQFPAQFIVDGRQLIRFFGLVPDFLLTSLDKGDVNTIGSFDVGGGSSLIKSNGLFLTEPSTLSQIAALGILIEVLEFRRPRYLFLLTLGL